MITSKEELKNNITQLMHGYLNEKFNISPIYNELLNCDLIKNNYVISAKDIMLMETDDINILKEDDYPLLSKTLKHTLSYLYLRLNVVNVLVKKFEINTSKYDLISKIIIKAIPPSDQVNMSNRVFFLAKKTLLNEFNHFEMDMNILQPAIDITNTTLKKERYN